jgi:hypothetical protein
MSRLITSQAHLRSSRSSLGSEGTERPHALQHFGMQRRLEKGSAWAEASIANSVVHARIDKEDKQKNYSKFEKVRLRGTHEQS